MSIEVAFYGAATQGAQPLLIVEARACGAGCSPRLSGLDLVAFEGGDGVGDGDGGAMLSYVTELAPPTPSRRTSAGAAASAITRPASGTHRRLLRRRCEFQAALI